MVSHWGRISLYSAFIIGLHGWRWKCHHHLVVLVVPEFPQLPSSLSPCKKKALEKGLQLQVDSLGLHENSSTLNSFWALKFALLSLLRYISHSFVWFLLSSVGCNHKIILCPCSLEHIREATSNFRYIPALESCVSPGRGSQPAGSQLMLEQDLEVGLEKLSSSDHSS